MNNAKPEAVYLNRIFMKWHHMAKEFWRFNKGTNGIYRFVKFFYKVKPPDLSIEQSRLQMSKYTKTDFTRLYYSFGSGACL